MKVLEQILNLFLLTVDVLFSSINGLIALFSKKDNRHKASFGDGEFLSRYNEGFNVNGTSLSIESSRQGLCVSGESGSFKTSGMLIKSCLFAYGSQIIHAPNFEVYETTSGFRSLSDTIKLFCPTQVHLSAGFNPLLRCTKLAEINRLSNLCVTLFSSKSEQGSFWNNRAQELITVFISRLKKKDIDRQYQTLPNVCHLLDLFSSEKTRPYVDSLFMDLGKKDDWLFQKYESISAQSDSVLQGSISSAQSALSIFELDDDIRLLASNDHLGDFDSLRKEPTSLYLVSSTTKGDYYSPLITILMDQFFESFFSRIPNSKELDVFFHIDEAPLIKLDWDVLCANVRKHHGSIALLSQDPFNQFSAIYGEHRAKAILSNLKTKAYFSMNYETALRVEKELGIFTYKDEFDDEKMKTRSLRTASELMQIPEDHVLVTHTGQKPILTEFTPYFEDRQCQKALLDPAEPEQHNHKPVQLLPLQEMYPNSLDHEL